MAKQGKFLNIPFFKGPAIYAILNRDKMTVYVGQTQNVNKRALQHDEQMSNNRHFNQSIQNDVNRGENLDFIVLHRMPENTTEKELKLLEKLFMLEFINSGFKLYNQTMNTRENLMSNIIIDMMLEYRINEIITDTYIEKYNKHFCYDITVLNNKKHRWKIKTDESGIVKESRP